MAKIKLDSQTEKTIKTDNVYRYKNHKKNFWQSILYAIIPFLIYGFMIFLSWYCNQLLNKPGTNYPEIPLDTKIPLVPWFVYPYFLTFPVGIVAFFYMAYSNKKALFNLFLTLVISYAISGIIYFFWQTEMIKPVLEANSFTEKFLLWTWGSCNPTCCFPSQHCFMAIATIIACLSSGKKMNIFFKIFAIIMGILIILATVFLKQHFVMDFVASLVIMVPIYFTVKLCNFGNWAKHKTYKKYKAIAKKDND